MPERLQIICRGFRDSDCTFYEVPERPLVHAIFTRARDVGIFRKNLEHHVVDGFDNGNWRKHGHERVQGVEQVDVQFPKQAEVEELLAVETSLPGGAWNRNVVPCR